jgi:hypothetical protein
MFLFAYWLRIYCSNTDIKKVNVHFGRHLYGGQAPFFLKMDTFIIGIVSQNGDTDRKKKFPCRYTECLFLALMCCQNFNYSF